MTVWSWSRLQYIPFLVFPKNFIYTLYINSPETQNSAFLCDHHCVFLNRAMIKKLNSITTYDEVCCYSNWWCTRLKQRWRLFVTSSTKKSGSPSIPWIVNSIPLSPFCCTSTLPPQRGPWDPTGSIVTSISIPLTVINVHNLFLLLLFVCIAID